MNVKEVLLKIVRGMFVTENPVNQLHTFCYLVCYFIGKLFLTFNRLLCLSCKFRDFTT